MKEHEITEWDRTAFLKGVRKKPLEKIESGRQMKTGKLRLRALEFLSMQSIQLEAGRLNEPEPTDNSITKGVTEPSVGRQPAPNRSVIDVFNRGEETTGIRLRGNTAYEYVCMRGVQKDSNETVSRRSRNRIYEREQELLGKSIHGSSRIFLSWRSDYPTMTFSVIKYHDVDSRSKKAARLKTVIMETPRRRLEMPKILSDETWLQNRRGTSYSRYLNEAWAAASSDIVDPVVAAKEEAWDRNYNPESLDDVRIRQGKHRTVQILEGYYFSLLPYTKQKDMKAELNEVFREQHPTLPDDLSLSKIRNLKIEVLELCKSLNLELSTAALAVVYFEKLVFKGVVAKSNRKLVMSVCFVLAFKFNEPKLSGSATFKQLLDDIERVQGLPQAKLLEAEFPVFGHLLFHLNIERETVMVHFNRFLKSMELTPREYLGEDLAGFYFPDNSE